MAPCRNHIRRADETQLALGFQHLPEPLKETPCSVSRVFGVQDTLAELLKLMVEDARVDINHCA